MNIDCSSAGYPKPTIWWKVGKNILASINGTVRSDLLENSVDNGGFIGTFRIFNNGTLNINGSFTQTSISSDYLTCVASNSAGRKLQVHHFRFEKCKYCTMYSSNRSTNMCFYCVHFSTGQYIFNYHY